MEELCTPQLNLQPMNQEKSSFLRVYCNPNEVQLEEVVLVWVEAATSGIVISFGKICFVVSRHTFRIMWPTDNNFGSQIRWPMREMSLGWILEPAK